jgi:hypothetical protein
MASRHRAGGKADIGMADAAPGDFDDDFAVGRLEGRKGAAFEPPAGGNQGKAVCRVEL